jgi:hypothetical protein
MSGFGARSSRGARTASALLLPLWILTWATPLPLRLVPALASPFKPPARPLASQFLNTVSEDARQAKAARAVVGKASAKLGLVLRRVKSSTGTDLGHERRAAPTLVLLLLLVVLLRLALMLRLATVLLLLRVSRLLRLPVWRRLMVRRPALHRRHPHRRVRLGPCPRARAAG